MSYEKDKERLGRTFQVVCKSGLDLDMDHYYKGEVLTCVASPDFKVFTVYKEMCANLVYVGVDELLERFDVYDGITPAIPPELLSSTYLYQADKVYEKSCILEDLDYKCEESGIELTEKEKENIVRSWVEEGDVDSNLSHWENLEQKIKQELDNRESKEL